MTETLETDVAIIGAGPVGLFSVFELGLLGLEAVVIDTLDKPGGQCAELYPEKPIYDIPALPVVSGQELTDRLMQQIAPFAPRFLLDQRVELVGRRQDNSGFELETSLGRRVLARAVFIAAGAGSFAPRRPKVAGLAPFENRSLHYAVRDRAQFAGRDLVILGGGDSALDWSLELMGEARSLTLVHRRAKFRGHPASISRVQAAIAEERISFIEGELETLQGGKDGTLARVGIRTQEQTRIVPAEQVLAFFGLNIELGPIADWGLDLAAGRQISVDTERFETSTPGIFAVGDINSYPGKLKLILSGFHESALASQAAFGIARPDEKLRFQYTTSSSELQKRLGVAA